MIEIVLIHQLDMKYVLLLQGSEGVWRSQSSLHFKCLPNWWGRGVSSNLSFSKIQKSPYFRRGGGGRGGDQENYGLFPLFTPNGRRT